MKALALITTLLLGGCTSNLTAFRGQESHLFEELKGDIADLKHTLHATEVELKLLEEKIENQELAQKKIAAFEKSLDRLSGELKSLSAFATQTTTSLSQYRDHISEIDRKLSEISNLRATLSQISKSYTTQEQTYQVKSGDSLEKIAKKFEISVETLKKNNHLTSDRIVIGQQLIVCQ